MAEWTDFEQKEPETAGKYLCVEKSRFDKGFVRYGMFVWLPYPKYRGWYLEDGCGGLKAYTKAMVKYWIPIPDLPEPKEVDENGMD